VLKQVRRARAMAERGITAEAIETVLGQLEEALVEHESVLDAAGDLERAGCETVSSEVEPVQIEQRLAALHGPEETGADTSVSSESLEARLYE